MTFADCAQITCIDFLLSLKNTLVSTQDLKLGCLQLALSNEHGNIIIV